MSREFTYNLAGKELVIETGLMAEQANGACLVKMGDTVILVTATASDEPREGIDFFPLTCDFEEKLYAVGKIPGGFIKREGRPSEKGVLAARLIDRPLRPLFPESYRNDVQIIVTPLSVDLDDPIEVLSMIGSSVALSISNIPFQGPTAAVNVGLIDGEFKINLGLAERDNSSLDLTVAGTEEAIMMVEASSNILPEETILEAILRGHEEITEICRFIDSIVEEIGQEKSEVIEPVKNEELIKAVSDFVKEEVVAAARQTDRKDRGDALKSILEKSLEKFGEDYPDEDKAIKGVIDDIEKDEIRRRITKDSIRPDGRTPKEIRDISCQVGLLPRAHGSGLFTRGQTQVLSVTTLGAPSEVQHLDGFTEEEKRFMHHYNFPPYSVGETRPLRSPGRREIGHGALAEKALTPVLPSEDEFPYTIRVVSEVLSSNGSSSQGAVCGTTLSLMDAGVPIKDMVAGIAMGLVEDTESESISILSDIQGLEDFLGDMDLKVAGTEDGITVIQMDIKVDGISKELLSEALESARQGRLHILEEMRKSMTEPREKLSDFAPRIFSIQVKPDKIRDIIGPGGKIINEIIDETGVKIDTHDDGRVVVTAENGPSGEKAIEMIEDIVKEVEVGESYMSTVKKIMNFGAFVEVLPGKEGLVHISEIAHERIDKVEDVLSEGDKVMVKVIEIDGRDRINLSRKALLPRNKD